MSTDCIWQEKKEEEVLLALKIDLTHQYNDSKITLKKLGGWLITATKNKTDDKKINRANITRKQNCWVSPTFFHTMN